MSQSLDSGWAKFGRASGDGSPGAPDASRRPPRSGRETGTELAPCRQSRPRAGRFGRGGRSDDARARDGYPGAPPTQPTGIFPSGSERRQTARLHSPTRGRFSASTSDGAVAGGMCVVFLYVRTPKRPGEEAIDCPYAAVVAVNRDESYTRDTARASTGGLRTRRPIPGSALATGRYSPEGTGREGARGAE